MSNHSIIFVGLDTHKEFTEIAYSLNNRRYPIQHLGRIKTTKFALSKLSRRIGAVLDNESYLGRPLDFKATAVAKTKLQMRRLSVAYTCCLVTNDGYKRISIARLPLLIAYAACRNLEGIKYA